MNDRTSTTVNLGLFGLGTVGSGVVKILQAQSRAIEKKTGVRLVLKKVCVRSLKKKRSVRLPKGVLTTDPADVLHDPSIDIVIELIGGIHPPKEILERAFSCGKHVVTANKALLAERGREVFAEAYRHGRRIGFEASVCGGIPIIKSVKEGLASNEISGFLGIVNGTCNFILSAMTQFGVDFRTALSDAQRGGYAEADPALDVDGIDSAHKLAVLARLAFKTEVDFRKIHVEGIRGLSANDIEYAAELGYVIKLLAIAKKKAGGLELRVHPTMLPLDHPLATVRGVYNAVFLNADQAGDLLFYGRGAGQMPTASAVMSDVIDIAKRVDASPEPPSFAGSPARVLPVEDALSTYYLRFQVQDKPGVLGGIAQTLGRNDISILSVHQKESPDQGSVPVVILTYAAREKNLRRALSQIDARKDVRRKTVVLRVEK